MAYQSSPVLDFSFKAAEDLSDYQYHFVKIDTSGQARLLNSGAEIPDGVLQNAPASAEGATVRMLGISKVVANAALDEGTFIKAEYVGAADNGKAQDATLYKDLICGRVIGATGAEDDLASIVIFPYVMGTRGTVVTTEATAGAVTYTAAEILGGLILRDPAGGARSDVTPTAVDIIAAMTESAVGDSFEFTIRNTADAAETITVTAGTDVTLSGTMTIAQNNTKRFLCIKTAATTATVYSLGTIVH